MPKAGSMSKAKLVIFDCDGVLVDTEEVSCRQFAAALAKEGIDWDVEKTMQRLMGRSLATCVSLVEQEIGRHLPASFAEDLQVGTFQAFRDAPIKPVEGIRHTLDVLVARGVPFCVASSGMVDKMQLTLGLTELWPYFDGRVFSASMVARGKPFPDLFLHAAQQMAKHPADCVVIEDAVPGVTAARAAGMRALAYAGAPYADPGALRAAGGELFEKMSDLPELIGL